MVITDVNQVIYNGDGVTTAWPFTFQIIDSTDLRLTLINAAGARTDITSDYYVDMVNNTVYYPGYAPGAEPPEANQPPKVQSGEKLEIYRRVPVNQLADIGEKWPFNVIEKGLDKLTMICQDIYSWIGRNIVGLTEDGTAWDARNLPISNVGGPVNVEDAATKDYVDRILNGFVLAGDSRTVPFDDLAQLKSADIEAGQISFSLGYHDINDGGAGVYAIRAKTPYDVENGGSIIFLDNGNVAELITDGTVNVKQFGAKGDGVTDDTAAIRNAINSGYTVYVPKGHYILTEEIENTTGLTMYGDGDDSIIDFGSSLPNADDVGITISGTIEYVGKINTVSANSHGITFTDTVDVNKNDLLVIFNDTDYSFSNFRAYYKAGEFCKVVSFSSNTAILDNPLYDSYNSADVNVYKVNSVPVELSNFRIVGTSTQKLLKVILCENPVLENISAYLEKYACIEINRCYNIKICSLCLKNIGTASDDYGLALANSQNVQVLGGYYYGRRHGITIGGGSGTGCVPNRNVVIQGATIENGGSSYHAADMHGNVDGITYSNCTIFDGVIIAGYNTAVINNRIISASKRGICVYAAEMLGGVHKIAGNVMESYGSPITGGNGYIDLNANINEKVRSNLTFDIVNNSLDVHGQSTSQYIVRLYNYGCTKKINVRIDGFTLINSATTMKILHADLGNGGAENTDYVIIDNISGFPSGTAFFHTDQPLVRYLQDNVPLRLQTITGTLKISTVVGANYSTAGTVSFKYTYPRFPHTTISSVGGAAGSDYAQPSIESVAGSSFKPFLYAPKGGAGWSAAEDKTVFWRAGISEI